MRFLDQHGKPRPLDEVFAENLARVSRSLRARETARSARLKQAYANLGEDVVIVRGTTQGGMSQADRARVETEAARLPSRNPLAW